MILSKQWASLLFLEPSFFQYPYEMDFSIVSALDRFIELVGSMPLNLSDYRPGDPRQHGLGRAIDTTWPNRDPLEIWNLARQSHLFSGLGIYLNDRDVVSFHFDTRADRTPDDPALWGDFITHSFDESTNSSVRQDEYTIAASVIDVIKKKSLTEFLVAASLMFGLYLLSRGGR